MSLRVGSAFAGIGGFDLALERAGMQVVWQIEIDPTCRRVLERHWPGVMRHDDIRTATGAALPAVDVITGGWPCQDLSVAGQRAGLSGARSGLFYDLCSLIAALRPTWIVLENVPGLLSSQGGRDMGAVLGALVDLGYSVAYRVLDAQFYGVPQRRRRVFFVGHLGDDWRAPAAVLFDAASCRWDLAPRRAAGTEVAGTLGGGSGRRGWCDDFDRSGAFIPETAFAVRSDPGGVGQGHNTTFIAQCHGGNVGPMGALRSGASHSYQMVAAPLTASYAKQVDNSDRNGGPPNVLCTGMTVRRLTPRECERLQGFPDGWTCLCDAKGDTMHCTCPDSPRYRALGNAVAVPVAEWIGRRIMAVEATNNTRAEAR